MTSDDHAALRQALMDELARMETAIQLADAKSRGGADPFAIIAAQEARLTRDRLLNLIDQLDGVDTFGRIVTLVLDDPSVQAAGDQLHAARNGPPPGLDHDTWEQGRHDALKVFARITVHRAVDQLGIPADQLPRALEIAGRILDEENTDE
jgi:hypothetical protein